MTSGATELGAGFAIATSWTATGMALTCAKAASPPAVALAGGGRRPSRRSRMEGCCAGGATELVCPVCFAAGAAVLAAFGEAASVASDEAHGAVDELGAVAVDAFGSIPFACSASRDCHVTSFAPAAVEFTGIACAIHGCLPVLLVPSNPACVCHVVARIAVPHPSRVACHKQGWHAA